MSNAISLEDGAGPLNQNPNTCNYSSCKEKVHPSSGSRSHCPFHQRYKFIKNRIDSPRKKQKPETESELKKSLEELLEKGRFEFNCAYWRNTPVQQHPQNVVQPADHIDSSPGSATKVNLYAGYFRNH